jgi:hypothetical protein
MVLCTHVFSQLPHLHFALVIPADQTIAGSKFDTGNKTFMTRKVLVHPASMRILSKVGGDRIREPLDRRTEASQRATKRPEPNATSDVADISLTDENRLADAAIYAVEAMQVTVILKGKVAFGAGAPCLIITHTFLKPCSMNNWFGTYEKMTGDIIRSHLRSALPDTIQDAMARPAPPHLESQPAISLYHGLHRCSGLNAREQVQGRWCASTVCRRFGHEMFRIPQPSQGRFSRPWVDSQYQVMKAAHYASQKRVRAKDVPTTRTWSRKHGWRLGQCACE